HGQLEKVKRDIETRNANDREEFEMTIGDRTYKGKKGREEAGIALNDIILKWRGDPNPRVRGQINGFDIVSRDEANGCVSTFLRGQATYAVHLNADNPIGSLMSIERTLRGLETVQTRIESEIERDEKAMVEYQVQGERDFEHEERLKELLVEQARLNAALDLDKDDKQATTADNDNEEIAFLDAESVISADAPERGGNDSDAFSPEKSAALSI
ncbi:MAG: hypothetical protein WCD70_01200, partial [Alphaproteobacteria bacterium]